MLASSARAVLQDSFALLSGCKQPAAAAGTTHLVILAYNVSLGASAPGGWCEGMDRGRPIEFGDLRFARRVMCGDDAWRTRSVRSAARFVLWHGGFYAADDQACERFASCLHDVRRRVRCCFCRAHAAH